MKERPSTILLSGEAERQYEGRAEDTITPGMLIEISGPDGTPGTPGRAKTVRPHSTAGAVAAALFAREFDITGSTIEDSYEEGDTVLYLACRKGDRVYALLADGQDVTAGSLLQSNGDGTLALLAEAGEETEAGTAVVVALEDMTAAGDSARIKVEVL